MKKEWMEEIHLIFEVIATSFIAGMGFTAGGLLIWTITGGVA